MSNPHLCIKKPVRRGSGHDKLNLPVWLVGIPFTLYCRCRCAAPPPAPDRAPLQRAPGQPAVSQKRDRNILTPFCHKYYSGRGETLLGCRCGLMQSVSAACMPTNLSLSLCRFRLWIPALQALRRSAADSHSIPHTDRPNAWSCANRLYQRRSIPATTTVICERGREGGAGEDWRGNAGKGRR